MTPPVGFIGLGLMGRPMAANLLKAGHEVTVWNRTASKLQALQTAGAAVAHTAGDAVAAADHVHLALTDDAVVDAILAEVTPRLRPGAIAATVAKCRDILGELLQASIDQVVHGPCGRRVSGWYTGEQCQALIDMRDGVHMKAPRPDRLDHILA